ncbi:hypothetical protein TcasGA2_TC031490 [Tribolium castaneum]|uniref:Uncharacterized protein n=1 Tax=Tribolium castaneum TaxID=7070 RepID=A0A139WP16_TRICA|nr:hypothetical protein TcasGA2_TC031490 [Tribolium castaneum]
MVRARSVSIEEVRSTKMCRMVVFHWPPRSGFWFEWMTTLSVWKVWRLRRFLID